MKNHTRSFGVAHALALGVCVGLMLSSFSCGTRPPIAKCNKNTCAGCCDDSGNCFEASDAGLQSPEACGLGGITCQDCTTMTAKMCIEGQCRVGGMGGGTGGATGGGTGGATGGGTGGATGGGGGASGCNATNCAMGCCSSTGTCVPPAMQNFTRCGSGGATCMGCPTGQACSAKTDGGTGNTCQAPNCSTCLDTAGNCRTGDTTTDNNYCGTMGGICARCDTANGQQCMGGRCVGTMAGCNASNCDGCCAGNTCIGAADGGISNAQCGRNAAVCTSCSAGATCDTTTGTCMGGGTGGGGGLPGLDGGFGGACDSVSCPSGCCMFGLGCMADGMSLSGLGVVCGTGGNVCQLCLLAPDCATGMALGLCQ